MVSMIAYGNGNTQQYVGLSTDSKPTDAPNGSIFVEIDTSKFYFYDADSEQWVEWGN